MAEPIPLAVSAQAAFHGPATERWPIRVRRPQRSVVVFAGSTAASDEPARTLHQSLVELGVQAKYVGREMNASRIAEAVLRQRADAVELCLPTGFGGVRLLRELLHQLIAVGRRDVSIVVHRAK